MNKRKNTVLIADNDPVIQKMIKIILGEKDFFVVNCTTARQAICLAVSAKPDIILLENNLPDAKGTEVIQTIRESLSSSIILLSDCGDDNDIINGLNAGANDYIVKPFNPNIMLARIHAALRSNIIKENGECILTNGAVQINLLRHEVYLNGKLLMLTPKEYKLLHCLMTNQGKMLSHRDILKVVWGDAHCGDIHYLRVFIARIRDKIEPIPTEPKYIITVPSIGYRMDNICDDEKIYDPIDGQQTA